jgi:hypothetical protein
MTALSKTKGSEVREGVTSSASGVSLTGAGIDFYRILMIRQALQAQIAGYRISSKVPQGTTLARRMLGFKGNKESLLQQVEDLIARIKSERGGQ